MSTRPVFDKINAECSDIVEHLPTLFDLSEECKSIVELGVRHCVSTWAFVEGLKKKKGKLISVDIANPPESNLQAVKDFCEQNGVDFTFILGDSRVIELDKTDMLFIDTIHTAEYLVKELELHAEKANKYIVLHDTESCRDELWPVVQNFIGKGWKIKKHYENNNGLTILERE